MSKRNALASIALAAAAFFGRTRARRGSPRPAIRSRMRNLGEWVTPNRTKRLRKAIGIRGRKNCKRFRQYLRTDGAAWLRQIASV